MEKPSKPEFSPENSPYVKMALVLPVTILRKLRTFWLLGSEEKALAVEATILPIVISTGIGVLGAGRTQGWLRRWASGGKPRQYPPDPWTEILMAGRAQLRVRRATGIGGTCVPRSLTLWALLLRRGIPTDLRVGFRKSAGKVEGHAWIEFEGKTLNEDPEVAQTYSAFSDPFSFDLENGRRK